METKKIVTINKEYIDESVSPRENFYQYANGKWLKTATIPESESRWGSFYELRDKSLSALHAILEEIATRGEAEQGSELQKLRDFYRTAMDESKLNAEGIKPLEPYIVQIQSISSTNELTSLLSSFHKMGVRALWSVSVEQDEKNSEVMITHLYQGGIGLPERDYYFREDETSKKIREAYLEHMKKMFALAGMKDVSVERIMEIETALASASMTAVELRDIEAQYNKMDIAKLSALAPNIMLIKYFADLGLGDAKELIVGQPKFVEQINKLFADISIDDWKLYLTWRLLQAGAFALSDNFVEENFNFYGKVLSGTKELRPRWKRSVQAADAFLRDMLGKEYVKRHFPPEAKKKINDLVDHLIVVYEGRIMKLDWMSDETKTKAVQKLKAIGRKLGYPDEWRDYSKLEIRNDSYLENIFRATRFESEREIEKLDKPVDRSEWHMTPPTVNAYCNFTLNEIVFPAGIMQPPFFDADAEDAYNYAGIGSVIGHELTHAFDDMGSQFDERGSMKNWWNESDKKKFEERSKLFVTQFNEYVVAGDTHVNGELTLGENIADLGGLVIAFEALQKVYAEHGRPDDIDGFTPEQRFFIAHAQSCQSLWRDEMLRQLVLTNPHAPDEVRVNGPFSNMPEFYEAFGVKEGDALWRSPTELAKIW